MFTGLYGLDKNNSGEVVYIDEAGLIFMKLPLIMNDKNSYAR